MQWFFYDVPGILVALMVALVFHRNRTPQYPVYLRFPRNERRKPKIPPSGDPAPIQGLKMRRSISLGPLFSSNKIFVRKITSKVLNMLQTRFAWICKHSNEGQLRNSPFCVFICWVFVLKPIHIFCMFVFVFVDMMEGRAYSYLYFCGGFFLLLMNIYCYIFGIQ